MSATAEGRLTAGALARTAPGQYIVPRLVALLIALVIGVAEPAQAQFGALKKLKKAVSQPDSAAQVAVDSTGQPVAQATDAGKPKGSFLSKAASASGMMQKVTGVSAKDAALAASGVGVAGLIAKKVGGASPTGLGGNMLKKAAGKALQQKMGATSGGVSGAVSGTISSSIAAKLGVPVSPGASTAAMDNAMSNAMSNAMGNTMGNAAGLGKAVAGKAMTDNALSSASIGTQADAEAMIAFQQTMMQTAQAASAGDLAARAKLERWQAISLKYQAEVEKAANAAAAGDMAAMQRLQELQFRMMKEWAGTGSLGSKLGKP